MKIGILQCDSTNLEFRDEHGDYPGMFISIFQSIDRNIEFSIYDVRYNQYPQHLEECDAYLITGSRYSVYDDEDWIRELERYVLELNKIKYPLIGICFGHQMIAKALGGKTKLATQGWGVGVHKYKKILSDSWLNPDIENFSLIVSHQDQVTELPEGGELVAESDFCPKAAFRIEDHILSFQGHPEFNKEYSKILILLRKNKLGPKIFKEGLKSLKKPIESKVIVEWIINFLRKTR